MRETKEYQTASFVAILAALAAGMFVMYDMANGFCVAFASLYMIIIVSVLGTVRRRLSIYEGCIVIALNSVIACLTYWDLLGVRGAHGYPTLLGLAVGLLGTLFVLFVPQGK